MKRLRTACSALLMTMMLTLSACGAGSGGGKGSPGSGDPSKDPDAAALAWARCMRENGIEIPDPRPRGDGGDVGLAPGLGGPLPGVDAEVFESAKDACAEHAEDMGGVAGEGFTESDKERMVDFARCMREHGVDMPDPDFDGADGSMGVEIDLSDPDFEGAQDECQEFAPGGTR